MASGRALTATLPVSGVTIFCLKAKENGFVTELLPSRPADQTRKQATTILTLGVGVKRYLCARNNPSPCDRNRPSRIWLLGLDSNQQPSG